MRDTARRNADRTKEQLVQEAAALHRQVAKLEALESQPDVRAEAPSPSGCRRRGKLNG